MSECHRFSLGQTLITPGALRVLGELQVLPLTLYRRHVSCDWSELEAEDQRSNELAVRRGGRIFSSYHAGTPKVKFWVITEADRSATTILLPSEY